MPLLLVILCLLAPPASADLLAGRVFAVIDGDTVLFRPDTASTTRAFFRLRLADIDAPESGQPHGGDAKRALATLALERRATVDTRATDRYGRQVGDLVVDGRRLNAELVRAGHAWASRWRPDPALVRLEHEARAARRGLWADSDAVPPWRWRATHQKNISE